MPLARLSIKTALALVKKNVALHQHHPARPTKKNWTVTWYRHGRQRTSRPMDQEEAKRTRRGMRVYLAMLSLGATEDQARRSAHAAGRDERDWRTFVGACIEKITLTGQAKP